MSGTNAFKFVMLPPQNDLYRAWAVRFAGEVLEARTYVVAEDTAAAEREIADADAAFGRLPVELLGKARKLRWLQAPQIAPPAGYYYPEMVAHPLRVTNFREIFNDHISAHIMAFVLAFARGLHVFIPQQARREWKKSSQEAGDVVHSCRRRNGSDRWGRRGLGRRRAARLLAAFSVSVLATDARRGRWRRRGFPRCLSPRRWTSCCRGRIL